MTDVPAKTLSYWLPLITAVLGFASGGLLEWIRDRRAYKREAEARSSAAREARLVRKNEFQRQTLLSLQDAVSSMVRSATKIHNLAQQNFTAKGKWGLTSDGLQELNLSHRDVSYSVLGLNARVKDAQVRSLVLALIQNCLAVYMLESRERGEQMDDGRGNGFVAMNNRIGELLRKLDEEDEQNIV